MKKLFWTICFIFCFGLTAAKAQCPTGGIFFTTQQEIDDFAVNYPNCTEFPGSLTFYGDGITNVDGLSNLQTIEMHLQFNNNPSLTNLDGLSNLQSIGTFLQIFNVPLLTNLDGLSNIENIGGQLMIYNNPLLTDIDALSNLQTVGGLEVYGNASLTDLNALSNLQTIGVFFYIGNNSSLTNLDGLSNLQTIGGSIDIQSNSLLTNLNGLSNLQTIGGNLYIQNNPSLTDLNGLSYLDPSTITKLHIENNTSLAVCNISAFCEYLSDPAKPRSIIGNAAGCENDITITTACSVACPTGDFFFSTQSEIDDFGVMYTHCHNIILGNVQIAGDDITNLDGLSNLQNINGLRLYGNSALTNLNGLSNLQNISGNLDIESNPSLTNLDGLSNIENIGGDFNLSNNASLTSLDGLSNLQNINGLRLYGNSALTNLNGLSNLQNISGNLDIESNPSLTNLDGLSNIENIGGDFNLSNNASTNLDGLSNLQSVGGDFNIQSNPSLTNLDGLSNLQNINGLRLYGNSALTNLNGLSNLQTIGGRLEILSNPLLTNLNGLSNLQNIDGYLDIESNPSLTNLDGLSNLQSVGGDLKIYNNPSLTNLNGLSNLQTIGEGLNIESNPSLPNLDGLSNLQSVGGDLKIYNNPSLTNLDGLSNLQTIGGYLDIERNPSLTHLDGLSNLQNIGGYLRLQNNTSLTNLDGLANLNADTITNLYIENNTNLAVCNINSFCEYLSDFNNPRTISANAAGCADDIAIVLMCDIPCPASDITFTSQEQIDFFGVIYSQCTEIPGDVTISGWDITNFDGLSNIENIGGRLSISFIDILENLDGLSNLQSVGEDIMIYNNYSLTNLDGLSNLQNIDGYLHIDSNPSLTNLDGLSNIENIGGQLYIIDNASLTNLDGLSNLQTIEGYLYIQSNASLTNLDGLSNLQSVGEVLSVVNNPLLTNLNGLSNLQTIGGGLGIGSNPSLTNLDGLSNLQTIGGVLGIVSNPLLTNLNGLSNLQTIGGYFLLEGNDSLINLGGLSNLQSVGGDFKIYNNPSLTNLDGVTNLQSVGDYLWIESNPSLTNLDGLISLQNIERFLIIRNNTNLAVCNVNAFCEYLSDPSNPRYIYENAPGCENDMEVIVASCGSPQSCPAPIGMSFSYTDNEAVFSWDAVSNAENYNWEVFADGANPEVDTALFSGNVSSPTVTVTGLTGGTAYDFYVMTDCSATNGENSYPYKVDFTTSIVLAACGGNFYDTGGANGYNGDDENYTVTIYPDNPGDVVTVSFTAFHTETGRDGLMIYDGNSISTPIISSGSTYNRTTCPNGAWTGSTVYSANGHSFTSTHSSGALTFVFTSDGSYGFLGWEASVTCASPLPCVPPTITLEDVTAYEAEFSWNAVSNAEGYTWYVFADGADPEVDTALFNGNVSGTTATVSGLTDSTAYDFYVMADCGATDGESTYSSKVDFTTLLLPATVPWNEGFATTSTPVGWTFSWTITGSATALPGAEGNYIYKNIYGTGSTGTSFTTINVGTVEADNVLSFNYSVKKFNSPTDTANGNFVVAISTDGGENFTDVATVTHDNNLTWTPYSIDLASYVGEYVKVRITGNWGGETSDDYYLGFDNFFIGAPPTCLPPTTITLEDVTAFEAEFTWDAVSNAEGYTWYVFADGADPEVDTALFNGNVSSPTATVTGLTDNTAYDFYIMTDCGATDGESLLSSAVSFTTEIACPAPTGLTHTQLSVESAELSWTSDGTLFEVKWGEDGFDVETEGTLVDELTEANYTLEGLTTDVEYEFYVRSDCDTDGMSSWAGPYSFSVGYCSSIPTSNDGLGITGVTMGDTSFPVSDVLYYEYTDAVANIQAGTTVSSSVSFATGYTYDTNIWIDLNDDGIFDNATELVFDGVSLATNPTTLDTSFPLSPDAMQGTHKMRIGTADSGQLIPNPCYSGSYGVTIDLTINITPPPVCPAPTGLAHTQLSVTSAELSWTSAGALFELEWGEAGFTQGAGTTVTGITETSYELTGIVLDTEYEFYVRSDCDTDGYSTWAGPYSLSVGYCESVPTSHHYSGITNVVMGDTSFPVSSVNHYEYTDAIANIQAGTTVSSSVSFATAYTYDTNIWIDLNDDGIFDNATELVFDGVSSYYYPTTLDTSFPLGLDAMQGTHKMRIGTANSGQATPNPCYSGSYGVTIDLMVNIAGPVTWTGTEWINGSPAPDVSVLVDGTLSIATDAPGLEVNDMTVSENGSVTIESENSLTINGVLTNHVGVENFVVESDGNLIQNGAAINIGEITLIRDSQPMVRLDYTLWSSPVLNQNLFDFSPETINGVTNYPGYTGRIYVYDGENHYVNPNPYNENSVMNAGIGYLFRSPNNYDVSVAQVYNGVFKGVPFNGDLSVAIVAGNYTSVGNPYPSNLDADELFASNPELETLYFWTNTESAVNGTYVANNYAVYNVLGGVSSTGATSGASVPTGIITTGQGFIVKSQDPNLVFNNAMRTTESGEFFKTTETEKHRFWLNLSNEDGNGLNQILLAYAEGATMGVDTQLDGKFFGYDGSAVYSLIDQEYFTIQARNLPFETSDVIPLGFRATQEGRFKIELANFDGLFADGQKIYLKDNDLDLIQDLTLSDYEFESEAGEFNERFEIVYEEDETMGTKDWNNSDIQIYKNGDFIEISSNDLICSVALYDIQGRQLFIQSEINFDKFKINTRQFKSQVLVVQVETKNGKITNKKILN